ncbi:MAG: glycosyltransferase [Timaviella obliquedivisa GSE-PSE-MK23-08B]|jgi:glycosyltransferase involved in cell wall biosynthesis|nr:glycosyltransferase [Timaviella obliquedivisa GSE-PSE-MK23-08B]
MIDIYLYVRHFSTEGDRHHDGIVKAVHGLASGLVSAGAAVTVLSEGSATDNTSLKTEAGYTLKCFANPIQTRPSFQLSLRLKAYIRCLPPHSLVILNGIFHASIYAMSRLCRKANVPYIIAPHDVYSPSMFAKSPHLKWTYWWLLEKHMLRQAEAVQVLEARQGDWLRRLGVHTQILTIPNGTTTEPEFRLRWHKSLMPKLFFFGRIDKHHKGLDLLLEAVHKVLKETPVELVIQGADQGDRLTLERQAQQLSLNVTFLEPEYEQSPIAVMNNYDIFCLPSRFEGFGLAALEAMMAGRVLLVSEVAGISPHVQASGCGVVVQPTAAAIAKGLITLLQRRHEWKTMGLQGRHYAVENLDWKRIGAIALNQYMNVLSTSTNI